MKRKTIQISIKQIGEFLESQAVVRLSAATREQLNKGTTKRCLALREEGQFLQRQAKDYQFHSELLRTSFL